MIENIIFDLDGTLVDSLPGIEYSLGCALRNSGFAMPAGGVRPFIGPRVRDMLRSITSEDDPETLDALEGAFRASYDSEGWRKTELCDGAAEVLAWVAQQGIRIYLVTNKPQKPTSRIVGRLGIAPRFARRLSPDSKVPRYGSKAEMIRTIIQEERCVPSNCLVVGDSPDDLDAAAGAGVPAILVAGGYGDRIRERCRRIDSLGELKFAMAGIGGQE